MATTTRLKFDELNRLDYRKYFGEMLITPEQMRKRIALARDIEDVMLFLFAYWAIAAEAEISKAEVVEDTVSKFTTAVEKHMKLDPYIESHIKQVVNEIVDVTEKEEEKRKAKEEQERSDEEEDVDAALSLDELLEYNSQTETAKRKGHESENKDYWLSHDRAMYISENEANAFGNYQEYREAKVSGKTTKVWLTELDEKVRLTHTLAEGEKTDIDGLFLVGGSKMRFPKDTMYDPAPEEVINCRCTCRYE